MLERFPVLTVLSLLSVSSPALADSKSICSDIINKLGYPTSDYLHKDRGIFASEQHIFGTIICRVDDNGEFESIYRGDAPLAEDGFFGQDAIADRDEAIRVAQEVKLQASITKARDEGVARLKYEQAIKDADEDLEAKLLDIRNNSRLESSEAAQSSSAPSQPLTTPAKTAFRRPTAAELQGYSVSTGNSPLQSTDRIGDSSSQRRTPQTNNTQRMWSNTSRLNIRSCPSVSCGITGWVTNGTSLTVYEEIGDWVRIGEPQSAFCENGISAAIDNGENRCIIENGITEGNFSRWVSSDFLIGSQPTVISRPASCSSEYLSDSDNYSQHASVFCTGAEQLIQNGTCARADLTEWGWLASTTRGDETYFTYCKNRGGLERHYLNVKTGRLSR